MIPFAYVKDVKNRSVMKESSRIPCAYIKDIKNRSVMKESSNLPPHTICIIFQFRIHMAQLFFFFSPEEHPVSLMLVQISIIYIYNQHFIQNMVSCQHSAPIVSLCSLAHMPSMNLIMIMSINSCVLLT